MATKIITKEFPFDVISKFEYEKEVSGFKLIGEEVVYDGFDTYNDIYKITFTEASQNSKYAWAVYVEEKLFGWAPTELTPAGGYLKLPHSIEQATITAMLVTLKPVPTWLPVYDDEISTNTINELLTGST